MPICILLVEDDDFVRRATYELLTSSRHEVVEATDVRTAHNVFARNLARIDVVICDAVLPDGSGIELCRRLQSEEPELRVIQTSGYPICFADWIEEGSRSCFLQKPYSGDSLKAMVEQSLTGKVSIRNPLLPRPVADGLQNLPR